MEKGVKLRFDVDELLRAGSHKWKESEVDLVTLRNIDDLCAKVNALGYTLPMFATSCLRSIKDQQRINPKAMKSSHLYGCAVDVGDSDGKLAKWIKANEKKLIEVGLWCEDPKYTPGWCHFQTLRPASGNRFFVP